MFITDCFSFENKGGLVQSRVPAPNCMLYSLCRHQRDVICIYIYIPICPLYIYSPLYEQPPIYTPLTGLGQWHEQRRTTHSYSYNLSWSCTTSLASSCNWSCNQVYSHNKLCQWSGEVVQLSYDRRILRSATTMKDHQRLVPRPSHDRRTTTDD